MDNADFWNGDIPWFSPKDVKSFDLKSSHLHISESAITNSATRMVEPGTIFVVWAIWNPSAHVSSGDCQTTLCI